MTYDEYIKAMQALKLANENRIIAVIPDVEAAAYEALIEWMDNSLEYRAGSLIATDETIAILNEFDAGYLRLLNEIKAYKGAVTSFIKHLPPMADAMEAFNVKTNAIDWAVANIAPTQKLVINEVLKAYTENGLNAEFVQPLRDLLYQNIAAGTNVKEAKAYLKDYIISGNDKSGKLKRYLTQTSQQAVDGYTGAINKKLMETFDFPYVVM
ncbi:MAG: hypothetical protein ABI091_29330, partial [Ferruginibacter sp.]